MLTSELAPGDYIKEFCSTGPKSYSYVTANGKAVCKVKGFTLSRQASRTINLRSMIDLVNQPEPGKFLSVHYPFNIRREKRSLELKVVEMRKRLRVTYDKRVVLLDFTTIPYGFTENI